MRIRTVLSRIAVAGAVAAATVAVGGSPTDAAGVSTHGWMAVSAIAEVADDDLRTLLQAHPEQVRAGGMFPDAGYIPGLTFGEEAHWQRFIDAYTQRILDRDDCGDIRDADGPCADMVAHLMGVAAHGMGDEVWDWLFEPYGADLHEHYVVPDNGAFTDTGAESQMDVVALGIHGVPRPQVPPLPSKATLVAAFEDAGLTGVTEQQLSITGLGEAVWDLERTWVDLHLSGILSAMPWMSAHLVTAPGGVDFAATAIAGYWESIWGRLVGDQPATRASITYPAPGQTDIPATGWDRSSFLPGSAPGRGGARTRVTAVLTSALPYRRPGGPGVTNQQPAGTMTIHDRDTGAAVPLRAGYPRAVPYSADSGEHLIDVQPDANLRPCHWYEVRLGVETPLIDSDGRAVTPHRWSFRTECTGSALVGTITDTDGEPVEGAWVLAHRPGDGFAPSAVAVSGPDGHYAVDGLADDATYAVRALSAGPLASQVSPIPHQMAGEPVTVDFALVDERQIAGTVTGAADAPMPGVAVMAFAPTDTWLPSYRTTTRADGTYALGDLAPGRYTIAFHDPVDGRLWFHDGTLDRRRSTPVDVTAVLSVTGIDHRSAD